VLRRRLTELAPVARALGCRGELASAARLVEANGAFRERAGAGGPREVARALAERYLA
jgi:hypothetical protein